MDRRGRLWLRVVLFLFLAGALGGCRGTVPVVKVGLVAPFEGRERAVGYDAVYAARLAVRAFNEAGEGRPYRVALVALDDGGEPQRAREAAASLVTDPAVLVVAGHWLPPATAAAVPVYEAGSLPLLALGAHPLLAVEPDRLPPEFRQAYEAVTPFGETAGPYAGASYDGLSLALTALEDAESKGALTRESVAAALDRLQYEGLIGPVYQP